MENEALLVLLGRYLAELNGIGRDWIVMGDWNMPPSSLPEGWANGVGGFIAAPPQHTCVAEVPGSTIDYALICSNLATRIKRPEVIEDSNIKVHLPVELPVLAEES